MFRVRSWSGQFHGQAHLAAVAQYAEFHVAVLRIPLGRKFFAKLAQRVDALAVEGSNDVAGFDSRLFRR